jgi:hypothetical protein
MQKFSIVSAALLIAAVLALAGCGNALHSLHEKDGVSFPAVTFDKAVDRAVQGSRVQLSAKASGIYGKRGEDVTWELEGGLGKASINSSGLLSIPLGEPGGVLTVTARSLRRPEVTSTVAVKVEPICILTGVENNEPITVTFTDPGQAPMTGRVVDSGISFDQDVMPGMDWVIKDIKAGELSTPVKIGRSSRTVADTPVSLAFTGGSGSYTLVFRPADSNGFVPVGSYDELQLIRTGGLAGTYKQEADIDLLGDLDGGWTAIGTFTGTFDGDDKGIWNIYIQKTADEGGSDNQGLFGSVGSIGTIEKTHIRSGSVMGRSHIGGVAGVSSGSINGCSNSATVTGTGTRTGGVVGYINNASGSLTGCSNLRSGTVTGAANTGGVVGANIGTISNCSNSGPVTSKGTTGQVGGVTGYNAGTITGCKNEGVLEAFQKLGGIIGWAADGSVSDCHNTGNVSGTNKYEAGTTKYIAGIMGGFVAGTASGCSNSGDISGVEGIGGIVGTSIPSNTGIVITACYNTGMVTGGRYVGGVVGYFVPTFGAGLASIAACYNTGTVTGTGTPVGGVAGHYNTAKASLIECYWLDLSGADPSIIGHGIGNQTGNTTDARAFGSGNWPNGTGNWSGPNWEDMGTWRAGSGYDDYGRDSIFPKLPEQ